MGQILHRSATTTEAIRRAIQHSQESLRTLSRRHGINPKTVVKWRKRSSTADHRTGPTVPKSTVLSIEQAAVIVAFRKHTLLPLDDCLYALQATIPQLTRSSLHRCLERHGSAGWQSDWFTEVRCLRATAATSAGKIFFAVMFAFMGVSIVGGSSSRTCVPLGASCRRSPRQSRAVPPLRHR